MSVEEADARKKETDLLRGQLKSVQEQSNDYKIRQTELNDQIRPIFDEEVETFVTLPS